MNLHRLLPFAAVSFLVLNATGANSPAAALGLDPRATLSLDGAWQIVPDTNNAGRRLDWHQPAVLARQPAVPITIPSCWEETLKDYEGVAWYLCRFTPPADWKDRHVRLHFDAVNYLTEAWINGQVVGDHEGGFTPFSFDVSERVEFGGENILVLRVVGPAVKAEAVDILARNEAPHWRGGYMGGVWQSVRLEATHPTYVRDVFVEPELAQSLAVLHVDLANAAYTATAAELTCEIAAKDQPDQVVARETMPLNIPPGGEQEKVALKIPAPQLWSPDHPHLYVARASLVAGGKIIDQFSVRFGMREFTVRDGDFYLNGERLFIKGAFWEGFYPGTQAHPRRPEIVRKEITLAREAGFNLLRPWRHPPVPMVPDLADELGILLIGSPPVENMGYWPDPTPPLERRWTSEMEQLVRRDRNHPSIIIWETANEIVRKGELLPCHNVSLAARRLDPTRPIIDESGGSRAPWGSHVYLPGSTEPVPILDLHIYMRAPLSQADYQRLSALGEKDRLLFVSELGYGAWPDLPQNVARYDKEGNPLTADYRFHHELLASIEKVFRDHRLREIFPDVSALCRSSQQIEAAGNKLQLEAVRLNPRADGYCLHAFTDGDWVLGAGVLDIWRQPKAQFYALKEVQQPLYVALRTDQANVYADRGTALTVTAVNDQADVAGELALTALDAQGHAVWQTRQNAAVKHGLTQLYQGKLETAAWQGKYTLSARILSGGKTVSENSYGILVVPPAGLAWPAVDFSVLEAHDQLQNFFRAANRPCRQFSGQAQEPGPVLVADNDAWSEKQFEKYARLIDWVKRGGVAVWLKVPATQISDSDPIYRDYENNYMLKLRGKKPAPPARNALLATGLFPFALEQRNARGHWIPVGHYLRQHPVFDGLPREGFLDQPYQNVAPLGALKNAPGEELAGCVAWDAAPWDYYPRLEAWQATDLAVAPCGKGTMILSTFQILEHLGRDPLADKLLGNLLRQADTLRRPLEPQAPGFDPQLAPFLRKYREIRKTTNQP